MATVDAASTKGTSPTTDEPELSQRDRLHRFSAAVLANAEHLVPKLRADRDPTYEDIEQFIEKDKFKSLHGSTWGQGGLCDKDRFGDMEQLSATIMDVMTDTDSSGNLTVSSPRIQRTLCEMLS